LWLFSQKGESVVKADSRIRFHFQILLIVLGTVLAEAQDFTYTTNNGTLTITGYTGTNDMVVIPSAINGLPVTSIGTNSFDGSGIMDVSISDTVINIGANAFLGCTSLTNISFGNGVVNIDSWAFYYCTNLTAITIPNSVANIGYAVFANCTKLGNVNLGTNISN
jgi:hypothetical protein